MFGRPVQQVAGFRVRDRGVVALQVTGFGDRAELFLEEVDAGAVGVVLVGNGVHCFVALDIGLQGGDDDAGDVADVDVTPEVAHALRRRFVVETDVLAGVLDPRGADRDDRHAVAAGDHLRDGLSRFLGDAVGVLGPERVFLVDGQVVRRWRLGGEGESHRALGGGPDDVRAGATGRVEDVVRREDVVLEDLAPGVVEGVGDGAPVDHRVGVELGDQVEDARAVGEVGDADVDVSALALGELLVDAHDVVAVAGESVHDPSAGATESAGDQHA